MAQKTPLYGEHISLSAKMADFYGFMMPIQYSGIIAEHTAVRTRAGLFDISHMGELYISGETALESVQKIFSNDYSTVKIGQIKYSMLLNEAGGMIDDVLCARLADNEFLIIINASNIEKDYLHILLQLLPGSKIKNRSDEISGVALQGPNSLKIMKRITSAELPEKYYTFKQNVSINGMNCFVSRNGYTGEDGFEIYCVNSEISAIWRLLLDAGAECGLVPCGLGARDTLRFEAGMPLYGHELADDITPYEAGLGTFVKPDKGDFIGSAALKGKERPARMRVGLEISGKAIARQGAVVYLDGRAVGVCTSGTLCPSLNISASMALIETGAISPDAEYMVDVRGKQIGARLTKLPFYRRNSL